MPPAGRREGCRTLDRVDEARSSAPARTQDNDMASMIPVTSAIAIDPREIEESFVRASGPGGLRQFGMT